MSPHVRFFVLVLLLSAAPALAQDPSGQRPKPKNDAPKTEHLFGDWNGARTRWHDEGLDVTLTYTGEVGAVVSGGERHGVDYAQQFELLLDADWGKLLGLKGFSTHAILINRAGRNASKDYAGDNLFQIQSVYGGTHHAAIHLVEIYGEQKFARADLAFGRLPVGEDFATSPLYCMFMSTALCGYPHSLPAKVGFSVFPNSTWGARLRYDPGDHLYLQAGVYQVRPKFGGRYGFDWGFSGTTGTYLPAEIGWEPELGPQALPGHYKIGFAVDTSNYNDNAFDAAGMPFVLSGAPPRVHGSRRSWYVLADQMLHRNGDGGTNGLILFGGYVHSAPRTSQLSESGFVGLVEQGFLTSQPGDSVGVMAAYVKASESLNLTQSLQQAAALPLAHGAPGPQTHEWVIEGRYSTVLTKGFTVTPDVQYIVRPSASTKIPNAVALDLRATITF